MPKSLRSTVMFFLLVLFLFFLQCDIYSQVQAGDTIEFQIGNWTVTGTVTETENDIYITINGYVYIEELGTLSLTGLQIIARNYVIANEVIIADYGTVSLSDAVFGNLHINNISGHIDSQHIYGTACLHTDNGVINLIFDVYAGQDFVFNISSQSLQLGQVLLTNFSGTLSSQGIFASAFIDFNGFNAQMSIYAGDDNLFYASMENGSFILQGVSFNNMNLYIDSNGNVSGGGNALFPLFSDYIYISIGFDNSTFIFSWSIPSVIINNIHYQNITGNYHNGHITLNGELYIPQTNTLYGFSGLIFDINGIVIESPLIYVQNFPVGDALLNGQLKILDTGFIILTAELLFLDTAITVTNMKLTADLQLEYADNISIQNLNMGDLIIEGSASVTVNPLSLILDGTVTHDNWNISVTSFHFDRDGNIHSIGSAEGAFLIAGYEFYGSVQFENQSITNYILIIDFPEIHIHGFILHSATVQITNDSYAINTALLIYQGASISISNLAFDTNWQLISMDEISLSNASIGNMVFNGSAYLQSQPEAFVFSGSMGFPPYGIIAVENIQIGPEGDLISLGIMDTDIYLGDFHFFGAVEFDGTSISNFVFALSAEELNFGELSVYNFQGIISSYGFDGSGRLAFNSGSFLDISISVSNEGLLTGGIVNGYIEIGSITLSNINITLNREGLLYASANGTIQFLDDSLISFGFAVSQEGYLLLHASLTQIETDYFIIRNVSIMLDKEFVNISGEIEFVMMGGASAYISNFLFTHEGDFVSADNFGIENLMICGFNIDAQAQIISQGISLSLGVIYLNSTGFDISNLSVSWSGEIISMDSFSVSNLSIGDFGFSGSAVLANYPESISLSGAISLSSLGYISVTNLYMDGNWNIISVGQASASISVQSVSISGDVTIFKDMLYISGSASLPFLNGDIAFMADILKSQDGPGLFNSGYDIIAGGVTIPQFQVGGYSIMNSSIYFDSLGIEGEGGLSIPQVASIAVKFKFGWDGTFYHAFVAATGMNIPIGSTGFFLQGVGGGLYHYPDYGEWVVELYGMLGDVTQTIQGDVLLSVSNLGIVSGIGGLYVRGISMGMASFEFNNPGQVFSCQAWLGQDPNQGLDIYFATLKGAVGFQRNWGYDFTRGYGYITVKIYFLPSLSGMAFLSDNGGYPASCFLPRDGLSAGVQVGVWSWKKVYGARILWNPWDINVFECSDFPNYSTSY